MNDPIPTREQDSLDPTEQKLADFMDKASRIIFEQRGEPSEIDTENPAEILDLLSGKKDPDNPKIKLEIEKELSQPWKILLTQPGVVWVLMETPDSSRSTKQNVLLKVDYPKGNIEQWECDDEGSFTKQPSSRTGNNLLVYNFLSLIKETIIQNYHIPESEIPTF